MPDGAQAGPYTEEDLLDMVDADELGAGSICVDTVTGRRCRVRELFQVIPPAGPAVSAAPSAPEPPPGPNRWVPAPLPETAPVAAPAETAPAPLRTVYAGHPSLWLYSRSLLAALGLMAGGWYAGRWENGGWWLAAGWLSGGVWLAVTLLRRSSVEYRITTRRVEVERGLLSKSSAEIRIADIRAINVRKSGFAGLLGVGDLMFSSSSGEDEEVVFHRVARAHHLKHRVRRLQDSGK
jgi:Bacterial PH domain